MPETRFRDRAITFANGAVGVDLDVPSASPVTYHEATTRPAEMARVTLDGKLFLPPAGVHAGKGGLPLVMIVPGSLGVSPAHLAHAEAMTNLGAAAFVLDSFGARGVTSTVANQTQFSFAASTYDVLAAWRVLAARPEIDASRIGAQGHSRGGTAVLMAATRRFADAVLGQGKGLAAVYAAYPWSGQQFRDPRVGTTRVRAIIGDSDQWCSPTQVQAHVHAIRLAGGDATLRIVAGAHHSFDRGPPVYDVPEASVAPAAPITYVDDTGAFILPTGEAGDPALTDRETMIYGLKAGYGRKGAKLGGRDGDAALFRDDMIAFWTSALGLGRAA
jgi:dienelactone hydrolase